MFSTDDESEQPEATAADPPIDESEAPAKPIEPHHPPDPPDPCLTGIPMNIGGRKVWVPVPCNRFYIDKGDPPPEGD